MRCNRIYLLFHIQVDLLRRLGNLSLSLSLSLPPSSHCVCVCVCACVCGGHHIKLQYLLCLSIPVCVGGKHHKEPQYHVSLDVCLGKAPYCIAMFSFNGKGKLIEHHTKLKHLASPETVN